jgi:hypothetical protein
MREADHEFGNVVGTGLSPKAPVPARKGKNSVSMAVTYVIEANVNISKQSVLKKYTVHLNPSVEQEH